MSSKGRSSGSDPARRAREQILASVAQELAELEAASTELLRPSRRSIPGPSVAFSVRLSPDECAAVDELRAVGG